MERLFLFRSMSTIPKILHWGFHHRELRTVWCETTDVLLLGISAFHHSSEKRTGQSADQVSILKNSIHYFGVGNRLGF